MPNSPALRLAILAVGLFVACPTLAVAVDQPPCPKVISVVNRHVNQRRGNPAGSAAVAKQLGTNVAWVERCMAAYGRIPAARHRRTSDYEQDIIADEVELGEVRGDEDGDEIDWDEAYSRLPKEPRDKHPKLDPSRVPRPHDKEFLRRPDLDEEYWQE